MISIEQLDNAGTESGMLSILSIVNKDNPFDIDTIQHLVERYHHPCEIFGEQPNNDWSHSTYLRLLELLPIERDSRCWISNDTFSDLISGYYVPTHFVLNGSVTQPNFILTDTGLSVKYLNGTVEFSALDFLKPLQRLFGVLINHSNPHYSELIWDLCERLGDDFYSLDPIQISVYHHMVQKTKRHTPIKFELSKVDYSAFDWITTVDFAKPEQVLTHLINMGEDIKLVSNLIFEYIVSGIPTLEQITDAGLDNLSTMYHLQQLIASRPSILPGVVRLCFDDDSYKWLPVKTVASIGFNLTKILSIDFVKEPYYRIWHTFELLETATPEQMLMITQEVLREQGASVYGDHLTLLSNPLYDDAAKFVVEHGLGRVVYDTVYCNNYSDGLVLLKGLIKRDPQWVFDMSNNLMSTIEQHSAAWITSLFDVSIGFNIEDWVEDTSQIIKLLELSDMTEEEENETLQRIL